MGGRPCGRRFYWRSGRIPNLRYSFSGPACLSAWFPGGCTDPALAAGHWARTVAGRSSAASGPNRASCRMKPALIDPSAVSWKASQRAQVGGDDQPEPAATAALRHVHPCGVHGTRHWLCPATRKSAAEFLDPYVMLVVPDRLGGVLDAGQTGADRVESLNGHLEVSQPLWAIPWCTNLFGNARTRR